MQRFYMTLLYHFHDLFMGKTDQGWEWRQGVCEQIDLFSLIFYSHWSFILNVMYHILLYKHKFDNMPYAYSTHSSLSHCLPQYCFFLGGWTRRDFFVFISAFCTTLHYRRHLSACFAMPGPCHCNAQTIIQHHTTQPRFLLGMSIQSYIPHRIESLSCRRTVQKKIYITWEQWYAYLLNLN